MTYIEVKSRGLWNQSIFAGMMLACRHIYVYGAPCSSDGFDLAYRRYTRSDRVSDRPACCDRHLTSQRPWHGYTRPRYPHNWKVDVTIREIGKDRSQDSYLESYRSIKVRL